MEKYVKINQVDIFLKQRKQLKKKKNKPVKTEYINSTKFDHKNVHLTTCKENKQTDKQILTNIKYIRYQVPVKCNRTK